MKLFPIHPRLRKATLRGRPDAMPPGLPQTVRQRESQAALALVLLLTACVAVGSGCKRGGQHSLRESPPVAVETFLVEPRAVPETYEVIGTVRSKLTATVAAKLTAVILNIAVRPGDTVTEGAPLAQLDDREARAEFERARAEFERYQTLLAQQAVTRQEFDAVEARYRVARAALSYASITAPFDGIVAEKLCDVGDLATVGKPLFVIERPTEFRLEAFIPERFAPVVRVGTKVRVVIEAVGEEGEGTIGEIVPVADPVSRSFLVKVDLRPDRPLRSGMFGRAQLIVGERNGFFVPVSLVRERGQLSFVHVAHEGRAQMRLVKTGKRMGDQIELLSGVQGGERLIINPAVADGQRVSL